MSPDDDSAQSPTKLVRRPSRSRSLKFDTPVKGASIEDDVEESEHLLVSDDILDVLPHSLIQSVNSSYLLFLFEVVLDTFMHF